MGVGGLWKTVRKKEEGRRNKDREEGIESCFEQSLSIPFPCLYSFFPLPFSFPYFTKSLSPVLML
jgi:hypothetical protein